MARKAYKYRLYPNKTTEKQLYFTLNRCRELYNACLSERKDSYQLHERTQLRVNPETGQVLAATMVANQKVASVTYYGQKRELVDIKELREEYQQIASHVLQDVILRVERAFQRFFDGAGYPRFKGRDRYDSFTYLEADSRRAGQAFPRQSAAHQHWHDQGQTASQDERNHQDGHDQAGGRPVVCGVFL